MGSEGLRGVAADKLGWEKLFSQKFERNCRPEICFAWKQDLCLQEVSKERRSSREKNLFGIYLPSRSEVTELGLGRQSQIQRWLKNCIQLDSNAVSLFVWNWLSWQKVSDEKIQILILILILWRGALPKIWRWWPSWCPSECRRPSSQDGRTIAIGTFVKPELLHLRFADGFLKHYFQGLESITLIAQNSEVWRHLPR